MKKSDDEIDDETNEVGHVSVHDAASEEDTKDNKEEISAAATQQQSQSTKSAQKQNDHSDKAITDKIEENIETKKADEDDTGLKKADDELDDEIFSVDKKSVHDSEVGEGGTGVSEEAEAAGSATRLGKNDGSKGSSSNAAGKTQNLGDILSSQAVDDDKRISELPPDTFYPTSKATSKPPSYDDDTVTGELKPNGNDDDKEAGKSSVSMAPESEIPNTPTPEAVEEVEDIDPSGDRVSFLLTPTQSSLPTTHSHPLATEFPVPALCCIFFFFHVNCTALHCTKLTALYCAILYYTVV